MLFSSQGVLPEGYLDMDALSDITGVSLDKLNIDECGSQHSHGSGASDSTEILLNQNVSLSELDDSLLESVSQVGEHEVGYNQNDAYPVASRQNTYQNESSFLSSYGPQASAVRDGFQSGRQTENRYYLLQKPVTGHGEERQSQFDKTHELSPEDHLAKKPRSSSKYLTRKYPSDSNIMAGNGRQSVIQHHRSMPDVNSEQTVGNRYAAGGGGELRVGGSPKQGILVGGHDSQKHSRKSQQVWFHPTTLPGDDFEDSTLLKENARYDQASRHNTGMGQNMKYGQTSQHNTGTLEGLPKERMAQEEMNTKGSPKGKRMETSPENNHGKFADNYHGYQVHVGYEGSPAAEPRHAAKATGGDVEFKMRREVDPVGMQGSHKGQQEMLLGVKHDPDTNELYDDKVREGADLLSKIFGDPNGSFTSFSSTSRNSDKSDQSKSGFSLHENKPQTKQWSLDSSPGSEQLKASQSPSKVIIVDDRNGSPSYVHADTEELNKPGGVEASKQSFQNQTQSSSHGTKQRYLQWSEGHSGIDGGHMGHEGMTRKDSKGKAAKMSNGVATDKFSLNHVDGTISQNHESSPGKVSKVEDHLAYKMEELRRLELDIEEIHARKKMALEELSGLEQSLTRNKADMTSSENLVEEYRWQATQTRSELMELEESRNKLQEDCSSLNEMLRKSKRKETSDGDDVMLGRSKKEIFTCLQERDKFERELVTSQETLKRERERAKWSQDDLRENIQSLEEQLKKQQLEGGKKLQEMKEERNSAMKLSEEKFKREANNLKKTAETAESRIKQMEATLVDRNEEITKLRGQMREEKQKLLSEERSYRSQVESERQNSELRADEQERLFKEREEKLIRKYNDLENLLEERTADLRRSEERCRSQTDELQKIIQNKSEEVKLVRGLVRQQEDATRVLGERLRTEAREHVRHAVEKERESLTKEKERLGRSADDEKEKQSRSLKQLSEELGREKESHLQTKQLLSKIKHEADDLRRKVVEVHGERITSVQRAKQESSDELNRIKEKLHQFTVQAGKLEKIDQETAKAIYEECRRVAELVGMPTPAFKTPTRIPDEKPAAGKLSVSHESPTKEALASLRQCNDELRQRLSDMKKNMERQKTESEQMKKSVSFVQTDDDTESKLQQLAHEKNEEIQQLHKKYGDEINHLQEERRKDQISYKKTIAKLEQDFHKLIPTNVSSGTSRVIKREVTTTRKDINSSAISGQKLAPGYTNNAPPPSSSSSAQPSSSSTDLLKHLQDRVKKLRAENENLKKSSDKDNTPRTNGKMRSFSNSDSVLSQSKSLTISQLHSSTKNPDIRTRHHRSTFSTDNMDQVSRIQRLLNNTAKTEESKSLPSNTG